MAHKRKRSALPLLRKLATFWPAVGVVGLRQVGKSTLLRDQLGGMGSSVTLDEDDIRDAANASSKIFLSRLKEPALIDEIQKVPALFDALKAQIDRRRRPGRFFLTGSIDFSSRIGVRESLTGRIGLLQLLPMTLSEASEMDFDPKRLSVFHAKQSRFSLKDFVRHMGSGGLPVPLFTRDDFQRKLYFQSWIETTVFRDCAKAYGKGYDPELSMSLLKDLSRLHREGILPTITDLKSTARKANRYLRAFQDVFLVQKILCHEEGVGKDAYLLTDSGLAGNLMFDILGEGATLSLARIQILNEIQALHRYSAESFSLTYFKSHKGTPVDLVWNGVPIKILATHRITGWDTRALEGAMKKLKTKRGIIVAPVEQAQIEKTGISILPWTHWA